MNIKKLFIITSITLQVSSLMHAYSQDAYNAAFHAFDARFNPNYSSSNTYQQSAQYVSSHSNSVANYQDTQKVANALNTPEASAVGLFMTKGVVTANAPKFPGADGLVGSTPSFTNLHAAVTAAPNTMPTTTPVPAAQLSDSTNWTAAFAAFTGGVQAVYNKTIAATMPSSLNSNSAAYNDAQVIVQYLGTTGSGAGDFSGVLNATDKINLQNAFTAAGASITKSSGSGSTSDSGSTSGSGSNATPSLSLKQTNGYALQQAIESAKATFNQLVPGTYTSNSIIPAANLPA